MHLTPLFASLLSFAVTVQGQSAGQPDLQPTSTGFSYLMSLIPLVDLTMVMKVAAGLVLLYIVYLWVMYDTFGDGDFFWSSPFFRRFEDRSRKGYASKAVRYKQWAKNQAARGDSAKADLFYVQAGQYYENAAIVCRAEQDKEAAIQHYVSAHAAYTAGDADRYAERAGDWELEMRRNVADAYMEEGKYERAAIMYEQAARIGAERKKYYSYPKDYRKAAEAYSAAGDTVNAERLRELADRADICCSMLASFEYNLYGWRE